MTVEIKFKNGEVKYYEMTGDQVDILVKGGKCDCGCDLYGDYGIEEVTIGEMGEA